MTQISHFLSLVSDAGFVVLGLLAVRAWLLVSDASRGWLALSLGLLGVITLLSALSQLLGVPLGTLGSAVAVVAFMFSAYALLRFRGTFIRLDRRVSQIALWATIVVTLIGLALPLMPAAVRFAATIPLIVVWIACTGEPAYRFWRASRGLTRVQSARLRTFAIAYGLLMLVVAASVLGAGLVKLPVFSVVDELVILASIPLLYVAFLPPGWLRREWRQPEEEAYRRGLRELLLFSPTRRELADRALEWAIRLLGGDAAYIMDSDGSLLGRRGLDAAEVEELETGLPQVENEEVTRLDGRTLVVEPLQLNSGTGRLVLVTSAFTPFFGSEELLRLRQYATFLIAALDRVVLTERLAALERTKTEFLNLASHELRGPITVIRGYLAMVEGGSLGRVPAQLRTVLPVLLAKADEMNQLIEQMIEAARLEEGRLELSPAPADLGEIAKKAIEMIRPLADKAHPLKLERPLEEIPVEVDVDRIVTIVNNLLSNAIKYSPNGGEVTVSVFRENSSGVVAVADHGVGIPRDQIDRLFTRFGRIVTPDTRHIEGTGLGLYLSRELARLHGGDLTAESEPGRGSKFVLRVPVRA